MRFDCKYCSFCCSCYRLYMRHSFESHSSLSDFSFDCGIDGCVKSFSNFSAMKSHIGRNHSGVNLDSVETSGRFERDDAAREHDDVFQTLDSSSDESENSLPQTFNDDGDPQEDNSRELFSSSQMQRSAALFILTLKERHKVTQAAIDFTVTQMKNSIDQVVNDLHQAVDREMREVAGLSEDDSARIMSLFNNFSNPFMSLETHYFQSKFYEENFGLIQPITIHLGTSVESTSSDRMADKRDTFQYIPLLDGLASLLKIPEVYSEVIKSHSRSDNIIGDYCDGELYKSIPLFADDRLHSLQIIMYFDEIEVCNPLGGHAGIHKLGMFYYVLGNIRPELRSTLRAIQLIACVTCRNLNKYGFEKILNPFIEDVNTLSEDGIAVNVNGTTTHFYGTVLLLLADTLAAHQIGGFKVGVSFALRKCRACLASVDDMSNKFFESDFTLRDPISHDYHCSLLDGILATEDSVTYGVNQISVLNKINHFHVTNQLPQDTMHVLLEGVLNLETRLMISSFVNKDRYFTLDFLNQRITDFPYGRAEKQAKPPRPLTAANLTGSKLPLSASQMWNFSILLPLIIGDKIPFNEPLWSCFILLLDIVKYCTSQLTSVESAEHLAALIDQHHQEFKKCYPAVSITPKLHYMVHLPGLLVKLGPLVNCWCMQMEAKHSYFKKISQIGNFRNIPYSVAVRHQKLLCANLQGLFFEYDQLKPGPCGCPSKLQNEADAIQETVTLHIPNISPEVSVVRPNWIKIYGEEYHRREFVHIGWQENDLPLFAKILDIITVEEFPFFVIEKYKSLGINDHLLGFLIQHTHLTCCINIADLLYKYVFSAHSYIGDGQVYIISKTHLELLNVPRLSVD